MSFQFSLVQPPSPSDNAPVVLVKRDSVYALVEQDAVSFPTVAEIAAMATQVPQLFSFGLLNGGHCYGGEADDGVLRAPGGTYGLHPLRKVLPLLAPSMATCLLSALHTVQWNSISRFCGRCGGIMRLSGTEPAKACDSCGYMHYPRISPAIIVAVVKDDRLLLGRVERLPGQIYSVLAGFVEPGETLEACVAREVMEEAGIAVDSIRYFGSQPWPFPDSLMVAFTARYAGGVLQVDGKELVAADWFAADALPDIPSGVSISRDLIDWFVGGMR